jgi:O-antigen/teichoic acid export membrane protein
MTNILLSQIFVLILQIVSDLQSFLICRRQLKDEFTAMANLKSLAKDTAIYGLSSIVARFINYLLVPIQTNKFSSQSGEYGIITNVYAYVALLIIILTFGMETTFFRFMNKEGEDKEKVYSTVLRMVGTVALVSCVVVLLCCQPIAALMGYADHPEYIAVMYVTVALDAFIAIPFAYLRCVHKPVKFASLKIANIGLNILLNILYFIVLPWLNLNPFNIYGENFHYDVAWVFYINLFCSAINVLLLLKELRGIRFGFDWPLCRRMLRYAWPILVMGLAGQLNQCLSQILFPEVYPGPTEEMRSQLAIYGGCIKIAMIMVMITQAFRFAYEPFVFSKVKEKDSKQTYAQSMKYYLIFTLMAYIVVMAYLDVFKLLIGSTYWEGLRVVPIVMAAEIMFGVFFNLSFWYKLTDRTIWGAYFSGIGAVVLLVVNILLIPRYSYMACAYAGLAAYTVSMLISYFVGQKYYPVDYPLREIMAYVVLTALLCVGIHYASASLPLWGALMVNSLLVAVYLAYTVKKDFPLSGLPYVGKYFRKK